ncbi:MAG: hypothetical protein WB772_12530 [Xanthobacteraceae bacterium]
MIRPSLLPSGTGVKPAALAAVATPKTNAALNKSDRTMVSSFPIVDAIRWGMNGLPSKATIAMNYA